MKVSQMLKRIEQEKIALFHAGKTQTKDYVWLIEKERSLKCRGRRAVPRKKKPRKT